MKELTPEYIQRMIDRYAALMEGHKQVGNSNSLIYYFGKHCAWVDVYNTLYPEKEGDRAFPLDEKLKQEIIYLVKLLK